jgi:hypothetical protein
MANSEVIDLMQVIFTVAWVAPFVIGPQYFRANQPFLRRALPLVARNSAAIPVKSSFFICVSSEV